MQTDVPPLLARLDVQALAWTAFWAFLFSLTLLPSRRRRQTSQGLSVTPWWVVFLEGPLGSVIGGVVAGMLAPVLKPELRAPEWLSLIAVVGAVIGPLLGAWMPRIAAQVLAFFSQKKLGFRIEVLDKDKEGSDAHPDQT